MENLRNKIIKSKSNWKKIINIQDIKIIFNFTNFLNYKNTTLKERVYYFLHNITNGHICQTCKKILKFHNRLTFNNHKFCSTQCRAKSIDVKNKIKQTLIKNYGVDNPQKSQEIKNKTKITCLQKYGHQSYFGSQKNRNKLKENSLKNYNTEFFLSSPKIKNKTKQTCLEKYGVDNPAKSKDIYNKIKQTNLQRLNVDNPAKSKDIYNKIKQTNLQKYNFTSPIQNKNIYDKIKQTLIKNYGVDNPQKSQEIKNKTKNTKKIKYWLSFNKLLELKNIKYIGTKEQFIHNNILNFQCLICNKNFISKNTNPQKITCPCKQNNLSSSYEKEISFWLKSLNINIIENSRNIIKPFELDIYLPDFNLAIEFNGVYWHSELYKDKNYHLNKYNLCKSKNIKLIQIFENEWLNKKDIIKSIILNKLNLNQHKIYARNCKIKEINSNIYKEFLDFNHIQGSINTKIKIGLYFNNELISVIGLSQSRFKKDEIEIIRYCNKLNTTIIGGFSKLIKYIKDNFQFGKLISYIDLRYFNGNGYINNGFEIIGQPKPNYFYINKSTLENRIKYQKHKLKNILKNFDENLSEHENMLNNNIYRIYDVGNLKLQLKG